MLKKEFSEQIEEIATLCQKAGVAILSFYGKKNLLNIEHKKDNSPVTQADLLSHQILTENLVLIENLSVISEESSYSLENIPQDYWLIDPIDGTEGFIRESGEFVILITKMRAKKPVLAFIYSPLSKKYWFAGKDLGAYKAGFKEKAEQIFCKKAGANIRLITSYSKSQRQLNFFKNAFANYEHLRLGSALKFCAIAEGKADIYPKLSPTTSEWDCAAGDLLLKEAGGNLLAFPNQDLEYGKNYSNLNPPFLAFGKIEEKRIKFYFSLMEELFNLEKRKPPIYE